MNFVWEMKLLTNLVLIYLVDDQQYQILMEYKKLTIGFFPLIEKQVVHLVRNQWNIKKLAHCEHFISSGFTFQSEMTKKMKKNQQVLLKIIIWWHFM